MSAWKPKRFWKTATAVACDGGFTVHLDARQVRTPGKLPLVVPTLALAQAIAVEWDAQQGLVRPETMPCTRAANSALEKVTPQFDEVVDLLAAYGDSDLLCYRATAPQELIARQAAAWDPLLDWAPRTRGPLDGDRGRHPCPAVARRQPDPARFDRRTDCVPDCRLSRPGVAVGLADPGLCRDPGTPVARRRLGRQPNR